MKPELEILIKRANYSFVVGYPGIGDDSKFLAVMENVVLKFAWLFFPFSDNKNGSDTRGRAKLSGGNGVGFFSAFDLLLDIASLWREYIYIPKKPEVFEFLSITW